MRGRERLPGRLGFRFSGSFATSRRFTAPTLTQWLEVRLFHTPTVAIPAGFMVADSSFFPGDS
jgi:hypothetical protein